MCLGNEKKECMFYGKRSSSSITCKHFQLNNPNLCFHILFLESSNSLLTVFFLGTLTPLKLLFLQRMHIGSYQPLPHLKTNNISRLKILQRFSFVLRVKENKLLSLLAGLGSLLQLPRIHSILPLS